MPLRLWTDRLPRGEADVLTRNLSELFTQRIQDLTVREFVANCVASNDLLALCDYDPDYERLSAGDAINLRQVLALYSKRRDIDAGVDKRRNAVVKFIEAELLCKETNEILRSWSEGGFQFHPRVEHVIHAARRKISAILGPVPNLSDLHFRFGPGATTLTSKRGASALDKLHEPLNCSEDLLPIVDELLAEMPHLVFTSEEIVDDAVEEKSVEILIQDSRLDFVPKTFKVDRVIGVEPNMNTMFTLGVGDYIAAKLRTVGVDTRDQTRNQRLAREGSLTGALATLDLSSASDTVAKNLVLELLPYDWFELLSYGRSSCMICEGVPVRLEKFSSMGNGFTFPLETLIFYALTWASCEGLECESVSVYGDDIIVPTQRLPLLEEVLHSLGFIPNRKKTFGSGPFRESCGKDYFSGIDIRPVYVKDMADGPSLFVLHNFFARRYDEEAAELVLAHISEQCRIWGPDGFGDGHLIGDWVAKPVHRSRGFSGYTFDTFRLRPTKKRRQLLPGDYVYSLYCTYAIQTAYEPSRVLTSQTPLHEVGSAGSDENSLTWVTYPGSSKAFDRIKIYTLAC